VYKFIGMICTLFMYYRKLDVNCNEHLSYHYWTVEHTHFFIPISFSKGYFTKENYTYNEVPNWFWVYMQQKNNNNPPLPFKTIWKFNHFQFTAITVTCIIVTNLIFTTALFSTILSITSSSLTFNITDRQGFLKPMTANSRDILPPRTQNPLTKMTHIWLLGLSQEGVTELLPQRCHSDTNFWRGP
jgi:hypothetical protein